MNKNFSITTRRDFLKWSAAAAAACSLGNLLEAAAAKKIPVGLQLYSVRHECEKDLPKVLETVSKIGYKGVEFAGYYGRNAKDLRKMLDDNGLVCCGTHTGLNTIQPASLAATVEFNKTLGNKYLIVPGMNPKSKEEWLQQAKYFNEVADKLKPEGMFTGYHAHGGDFKKYDGETAWDIFFSNTKPEVIMQLDTGNTMGAGVDPVTVLKKYPGRAKTIHIKEHGGGPETVIGGGQIKWAEVFALCEAGGTEWYIVEHERRREGQLDDVRRCFEAMKAMGKC
jgi:sugar phosphate isomerase/epimerase